ncbi:MAG: DNA-formamidopyrimidine glycosylase [bacterium]|nr:DNA-formamidopyrimidine glycosylase [bacterium]
MPELPEVETIVRDLRKRVLKRTFVDVWTDWEKTIKKPNNFKEFKGGIEGRKIIDIRRRAKNILFDLSGNKIMLIHQKMTGHLLLGKWKSENGKWVSQVKGPLRDDPMNRFIHLIFWLDSGIMLALCDLRKFAKVELWEKEELENSKEFQALGPEPLEKSFGLEEFKKVLKGKKGKIKKVLMEPTVIAGIGNIYSDEILWKARIHPLRGVPSLSGAELKKIYLAIKEILPLAIRLGGESISDYRRPSGEKGYYDKARKVYRKEGQECPACGDPIERIKIGGRSAHFCPSCQRL